MAIIDGQGKKVCFLTLVNQVNGLLGGRSRVPNGLIMEEVDDGNKQQEERHRLTHLHLPPLDSPLDLLSCGVLTDILVTYIKQAEILLKGCKKFSNCIAQRIPVLH